MRRKRRVSKNNKKVFKNRMQSFIGDLSRPVLVYKQPAKYECPNCFYDKLTGKSTNTCKWTLTDSIRQQIIYEAAGGAGVKYKYFVRGRCPICKGKGALEVFRKSWIDCKVTWDPSGRENATVYTPAGSEGSTILELKTDPLHEKLISNSTKLIVDSIECKLSKPPIWRGIGNNTVLIVTAYTAERLQQDKKELIKSYAATTPDNPVIFGLETGDDLFGLSDGSLLEL